MTTEIIPFEQEIAAMQPLGLPAGYRFGLSAKQGGGYTVVTVTLWGNDGKYAASGDITFYDNERGATLENRLERVRQKAVDVFNNYVVKFQGAGILKSIEDRLSESRDMLVLQSTPAIEEDD